MLKRDAQSDDRPDYAWSSDGVPLYVRVAMSLRTQIYQGDWEIGDHLPPFEVLAERYGVGLNTVKRAVQVLASESLVSSARGVGTRVIGTSPRTTHPNIRTTINDPLSISPNIAIKVIESTDVDALPPALHEDYRGASRYRRVLKTHSFRGAPFALLDIYVAGDVYDQFPTRAERRQKISWLMRKHGKVNIHSSREELTITHSDQRTSALLRYPTAASLARLRRWHVDPDGVVLYACLVLYRGDLFVWDVTAKASGTDHLSDQIIPALRHLQP
jgi:DNA-binding GntR family transcriptional regulator